MISAANLDSRFRGNDDLGDLRPAVAEIRESGITAFGGMTGGSLLPCGMPLDQVSPKALLSAALPLETGL